MGLRGDVSGIEGLPLQLLIVAVVAGITAPVVYAGLASYDRGQVESRVRGEILRLARAAQQYLIAGGGAETLALDLQGGTFTSVLYVTVGDAPGSPLASTVRYRLSGDSEETVLVEHPSVPMAAPDGKALSLVAGLYRVHLEVLGDRVVVSVT